MTNLDLERRIKAGEKLTREDIIEVWRDVETGFRKKFPKGFLQVLEHRQWICNKFVLDFKREHKRYPQEPDIHTTKLRGLFTGYCNDSPYTMLVEAGFTNPANPYYDKILDKTPWLIIRMPQGYWKNPENKINAVRWLVEKVEEQGREILSVSVADFADNGLRGCIDVYNSSPFLALKEAGYEIQPTSMDKVPIGHWINPENRAKHVREIAEKLGRLPKYKELPTQLIRQAGGLRKALKEVGLLT